MNADKMEKVREFISLWECYKENPSDHHFEPLLMSCGFDLFPFQMARIKLVKAIVPKKSEHENKLDKFWDNLCLLRLDMITSISRTATPEYAREVYNASRSGSFVERTTLEVWNLYIKEQVQN